MSDWKLPTYADYPQGGDEEIHEFQQLRSENAKLRADLERAVQALEAWASSDCACESGTEMEPEFICGIHATIKALGKLE